ncbi:MAG: hypothetical protein NTV28_04825 [Propionibacteriales bacterium]|nr:hypothetical protein [Propionibacteriales bacterium]
MDAVADGGEGDVVAVHALDPGLVEVVGVGGLTQLLDGLADLDRLGPLGQAQHPVHRALDDHRVDVLRGVRERVDMVQGDGSLDGQRLQVGHVPQGPTGADQLTRLLAVEVELVTQPVLQARAALGLEVPALVHLRDQSHLLAVDRVRDSLQQPQRIGGRRVGPQLGSDGLEPVG